MDRDLIERLSDEFERKRMVVQCHQQLNVFGKSPVELQKMAREFNVALAEMYRAKADLDAAIRPQKH